MPMSVRYGKFFDSLYSQVKQNCYLYELTEFFKYLGQSGHSCSVIAKDNGTMLCALDFLGLYILN